MTISNDIQGKSITLDEAIAFLKDAKKKIGGDKCLILSLWDSELQDVNVNGLSLVNDEDGHGQYVQVDVVHQDLINSEEAKIGECPCCQAQVVEEDDACCDFCGYDLEDGEPAFEAAVEGLTDYYPELKDKSIVHKVWERVLVGVHGNEQKEYENVRDQVERLIQSYLLEGQWPEATDSPQGHTTCPTCQRRVLVYEKQHAKHYTLHDNQQGIACPMGRKPL